MACRRRRSTAAAVAAALAAAWGEGQRLGIADGPPGRRGRSADRVSFCPETMLPLVVFAGFIADSPL